MRGLRELVFSVTNRCTARCTDCPVVHENMPLASLDADFMNGVIAEILPWNTLRLVVFTGGEPFLLREELKKTIGFAASHGLLTRIVTNAYWASSKPEAKRILRELKASGLTEINISCDDFHQQYVPLQNVKNANEAAIEENIPALLGLRECPENRINFVSLSEFLGAELRHFRRGEENPRNNIVLSGKNVPIKTRACGPPEAEASSDRAAWAGPCPSVLSKIIISPHKRVEICCGIASSSIKEFFIGSVREENLFKILKQGNEDLIVNWLAVEGPASILEFVLSKDPALDLPKTFVNRCHVCNELFTREKIRRILHDHAEEKSQVVALMRDILEWANEALAERDRA